MGPDSATLAAARAWGVPEEWRYLAGYCAVRRCGPARRPRCRRCQTEFGLPGDAAAYCPDCAAAMERFQRDMAQVRSRDRRAGYRQRA